MEASRAAEAPVWRSSGLRFFGSDRGALPPSATPGVDTAKLGSGAGLWGRAGAFFAGPWARWGGGTVGGGRFGGDGPVGAGRPRSQALLLGGEE